MFERMREYKPKKVHRLEVEIDGFTPCLERVSDGQILQTTVSIATPEDIMKVNQWRRFEDWKAYLNSSDGFLVYKLCIESDATIQGLISFEKEPHSYGGHSWIELHVLESAPHNFGKTKIYNGVAAHLFAVACKHSIQSGCNGLVQFHAKTPKLFEHYKESVHAVSIDDTELRMVITPTMANQLVGTYFGRGDDNALQ